MGRGIVTGAASGIGRATAARLLREGVDVLAVDVDERGLEPLAAAGAETLVADLGDPAARERVAAAADSLDYLVNARDPAFDRVEQIYRLAGAADKLTRK